MSASAATPASPPAWTRQAVLYQVNVRQYSAAGTLAAVQADLPRLKSLGVDILWLMPWQPIGQLHRKGTLGSYYSIRDYTAVNPEFGTLADARALVAEAHRVGLKVMLDSVTTRPRPRVRGSAAAGRRWPGRAAAGWSRAPRASPSRGRGDGPARRCWRRARRVPDGAGRVGLLADLVQGLRAHGAVVVPTRMRPNSGGTVSCRRPFWAATGSPPSGSWSGVAAKGRRRVTLRGAGLSFDTQGLGQEVVLSLDAFRDVTVDAEARLGEHGLNVLARDRPPGLARLVGRAAGNPLVILLAVLAGVSLLS
ncbi:MAG: alpha-amylase family glycosyl hydrolase, partial [Roseateles sp.]